MSANERGHMGVLSLRLLLTCLGLVLMYIALFLREDEEGHLQNQIEELWIRVDDRKYVAMAAHIRFLTKSMALFDQTLNFVFGKKLLSLKGFCLTSLYSILSLGIAISNDRRWYELYYNRFHILAIAFRIQHFLQKIADVLNAHIPTPISQWIHFSAPPVIVTYQRSLMTNIFLLLFGVIFIAIAFGTIIEAESKWQELMIRLMTLAMPIGMIAILILPVFKTYMLFPQLLLIVVGLLCDVVFVVVNRFLVRASSKQTTAFYVIGILIINLMIAAAYALPIYWFDGFGGLLSIKTAMAFVAATNLTSCLFAFAVVLWMGFMLLQRSFWPFISRPIYAIARHKVIQQRKLMLTLAIIMLAFGIPAFGRFFEMLGKF